MRALRRAVAAVVLGALMGLLLRFRGSVESSPQGGGWRELSGDDLR